MKKIIILFSIAVVAASCSKKDKNEKENHCPSIAANAVPQAVKDSFAVRYPSVSVNTWFLKDSVGYCAYFIQPANQKRLAEFSRTGNFLYEEIDMNKDGNFEDSAGLSNSKQPAACECEIHD